MSQEIVRLRLYDEFGGVVGNGLRGITLLEVIFAHK